MNDAQDIFQRKFSLIQDQVSSMVEKIEEDKQIQAEITQLRMQELEQLRTETDKFFLQEAQRRRETEQSLLQMIDDKTQNLKQLIGKESNIRYQNIEELEETLQKDFPALQAAIKQQ